MEGLGPFKCRFSKMTRKSFVANIRPKIDIVYYKNSLMLKESCRTENSLRPKI